MEQAERASGEAAGAVARGRRRGDTLPRSSGVGWRGGPSGFLAAAPGGRPGYMRPRRVRPGGGGLRADRARLPAPGRTRRSRWRASGAWRAENRDRAIRRRSCEPAVPRRSRSGGSLYTDLPQVIADRAARLPDALVACDVRARAVQAVGDLPRGRGSGIDRRAAVGGLSDLLPLRHGLARDEHGGGHAIANAWAWPRRCSAELYARVGDTDARFTLEVRRSNHVAIHLYEREGFRAAGDAPPLLPGQRRGRARDVAHAGHAGRPVGGRVRSQDVPNPGPV